MTSLVQQISEAGPSVSHWFGRGVQRMDASPESYRASTRALWVVGFAFVAFMGLMPFFAGVGDILLSQQAIYLGLLALSLNLLVGTLGLISFGTRDVLCARGVHGRRTVSRRPQDS